MTQEEKRIKIAEACGWGNCILPSADEYHFCTDLELGRAMGRSVGRNVTLHPDGMHHPLPDYFSDLNAMHEAVSSLSGNEMEEYANHLARITYGGGAWHGSYTTLVVLDMLKATASQCAEAFGLTLKLWTP